MSLRLRLTAVTVALVALGLLAAGLATRFALERFLVDRIDGQFAAAEAPSSHALLDGDPASADGVSNALPIGSYAALVSPAGRLVHGLHVSTGSAGSFPARILHAPRGHSTLDGYRVLRVRAAGIAATGPDAVRGASGSLVIAIPLSDVNGTLN